MNDFSKDGGQDSEALSIIARVLFQRASLPKENEHIELAQIPLNPLDNGFSVVWDTYNRRIFQAFEEYLHRITLCKSWAQVLQDEHLAINEATKKILVRDFFAPLLFELSDLSRIIASQITHAACRLSILIKEDIEEVKIINEVDSWRSGKAWAMLCKFAMACPEWDALHDAQDAFWKSEDTDFQGKIHGLKFHDIISPPFGEITNLVFVTDKYGAVIVGTESASIDVEEVIYTAERQLDKVHELYKLFAAYARRLSVSDISRIGGTILD